MQLTRRKVRAAFTWKPAGKVDEEQEGARVLELESLSRVPLERFQNIFTLYE